MRRLRKVESQSSTEFELDLAPLLSVMVKLVPVLLLSSAFVQLMVIETELPQVVQQAIQKQKNDKTLPTITIEAGSEKVQIFISKDGDSQTITVPGKDGIDYPELHKALVEVKKKEPRVFKIEFNPSEDLPYSDVVKVMDEARRSRDPKIRFPVEDTAKGTKTDTEYMFPEIVFGNTLEG
ncbi:MAG: ExbD/TolR family protein [Bdellovibrionia bacterium]